VLNGGVLVLSAGGQNNGGETRKPRRLVLRLSAPESEDDPILPLRSSNDYYQAPGQPLCHTSGLEISN